jgi:membrane protein DedA with SNARE-associated domain
MVSELFSTVIDWYMNHINYGTVTLLMGLESTIVPFPSELIVPPAAWKAAQGEMNIFVLIIAATTGALLGSLFNYFLARTLGRTILYKFVETKWARLFLLNKEHLEKAENYFNKYGKISTFIGRLVPVIRHLISLPAGLVKMDLKQFCLYTVLGASIWNVILALLGFFLYSQKEILEKYYKDISIVLLCIGILFVIYLIFVGFRKKEKKPTLAKENEDAA